MNKAKIFQEILAQLEKDFEAIKAATLATYDAATNEESKPENEFDTRALEASYLAGAQAKRVLELEELIFLFKNTRPRSFSSKDPVDITALVEIKSKNSKQWLLVMPKGGGIRLSIDGVSIQTVTPSSPLGEAVVGLKVGEVAEVDDPKGSREFEITQIS